MLSPLIHHKNSELMWKKALHILWTVNSSQSIHLRRPIRTFAFRPNITIQSRLNMALDKARLQPESIRIFFFLDKNVCCGAH